MRCIVYGTGSSYLGEAVEILGRAGIEIEAYIDNLPGGSGVFPGSASVAPVVGVAEIDPQWLKLPVLFPLITPGYRKQLESEARDLGFSHFPAFVDPKATVAASASHGDGFFVNAGAVIGANCKSGRFGLVNRNASIGHDVTAEDFTTIGPGVHIGGSCHLKPGAFIGIGATLLPGISVGRNAIIGAGAVVTKDVAEGHTVAGNPAKMIKSTGKGYNGASV